MYGLTGDGGSDPPAVVMNKVCFILSFFFKSESDTLAADASQERENT